MIVIGRALGKQRKALLAGVEEKLNSIRVELERERLEKRDVVSEQVLVVRKIDFMMRNEIVDAIVGQNEICFATVRGAVLPFRSAHT